MHIYWINYHIKATQMDNEQSILSMQISSVVNNLIVSAIIWKSLKKPDVWLRGSKFQWLKNRNKVETIKFYLSKWCWYHWFVFLLLVEYYTKKLGITSCMNVTIKIIISHMSVRTNWHIIQWIIILVIVNIFFSFILWPWPIHHAPH